MSDFSSVVDKAASAVGKPNDPQSMASYVNKAIRFVEGQLDDDLMAEEILLTADSCGNAIWTIPDIKRLRRVQFAVDDSGEQVVKTRPSEKQQHMAATGCPYYYQSGRCLVFSCITGCVRMSVLNYSPWFTYYPKNERPAIWHENKFVGLDGGVHGPDASLDQIALVTSLTLEAHDCLVQQRAIAAYLYETNDPARGDANTEYQRLWNITTANQCD